MEKFDLLGLTAQQPQVVKGMILKEAEAFTVDDIEIGDVDTHKMKIQLTDQVPVQKTYKRIPKPLHKEIKEYVEGLLNRGLDCFIRIQTVRKKDGTLRLYCDYGALNAKTYP